MKLIAIRNNDVVTLIYKGKHHTYQGDKAEEVYRQYVECRHDPSAKNFRKLDEAIAPIKRVTHLGLLEEDTRGKFYLKGTDVPMPQSLSQQIMDFADKDYPFEPLIKFWKLCLLNPNKQARDDFFAYCQRFGIVITDHGYAVLYKSVNRGNISSKSLVEFVGKEYARVKRWKKRPGQFTVYSNIEDGHYKTIDTTKANVEFYDQEEDGFWEYLGDLQSLYDNIGDLMSDDEAYTPIYSGGDYGTTIRLGEPVTMPREECDPDISADCSHGLHVGHTSYVQHFGYHNNVLLAVLVNPMNVVALPQYDHSKIRTCEYYPYTVLEREEDGTLAEITEESYWEEDYKNYEEEIFDRLVRGDFNSDPMMEDNDEIDIVTIAKTVVEE